MLDITNAITLDGSEETREVYMKMGRWLLETNDDLILLSMVQEANPKLGLPSWVPDWSVPYRWHQLGLPDGIIGPLFRAGRGKHDVAMKARTRADDPNLLLLRGFIAGDIDWLGDAQNLEPNEKSSWPLSLLKSNESKSEDKLVVTVLSALPSWLEKIRSLSNPTNMTRFTKDHLGRWQKEAIPAHQSLYPPTNQTWEHAFNITLAAGYPEADRLFDLTDEQDPYRRGDFANLISHTTLHKRLFIDNDGCIGLAPRTARKGDLLAIFLGAQVPFVIRDRGDSFQLVGECYYHGFMDGELMRPFEEGDDDPPDVWYIPLK
jgi:hypothetical protein